MMDKHDCSRWRLVALAALLVLALGAASCGEDDGDSANDGGSATQSRGGVDPASFDNTPEGQIRAAHARYIDISYSEHPERICDFTSRKGRRLWRGKRESCEAGVKAFHDSVQSLSKDRPRILKVRIQGSRAIARTQVKGSNVYPAQFVKEDGEWKIDGGGAPL